MPDWLPIAFAVLICPLMMILMMRGHHGHHGQHGASTGSAHHAEADDRVAGLEKEIADLRAEITRLKDNSRPATQPHHGSPTAGS